MRHLPTLLAAGAAIAALSTAPSALAWGGSSGGGGGQQNAEDCCAEGAKSKGGGGHGHDDKDKGMDCCEAHDKGQAMECCEDHGDKPGEKHGDKHHGSDHRGMAEHRGMGDHHGMRSHQGYHGMRGMHGGMMRGERTMELRYMPATTGNQHIVLAWDQKRHKGQWLSMAFQGNYALQLAPAAGQGNWFSPYWGLLPRVGTQLGNFSADAGALLGVGGMFRTSGGDNLQFRPMWVVEPRVELGWTQDRWRMGLVGTYVLSPNPAEFSGPSIGFRLGFGGRGGHGGHDGDGMRDKRDHHRH